MPTVAARSALLSTAACCTSAQATLQGERGTVQAVAFSPDGRLLASGGKDHVLYLWNTVTGRLAAALRGPTGTIQAIARPGVQRRRNNAVLRGLLQSLAALEHRHRTTGVISDRHDLRLRRLARLQPGQ